MPLSVGIIGLPNAGKSTLFRALTKKQVAIASYPFTTINPNVGIVSVPDERLQKLSALLQPPKVTPAVIELIDIAGLVRDAHKGEGLGNQFLSHIRGCDALLHLIRCFQTPEIEHVERTIDPIRDKEIVETELLLKDLKTVERMREETRKGAKGKTKEEQKLFEVLERAFNGLARGIPLSQLELKKEENDLIKPLSLLTAKPILYVLNVGNKNNSCTFPFPHIQINAEEELEIAELPEEESASLGIKSGLDLLIRACYDILDLITFFTITGGNELRAWSIKRGTPAKEAAGKVHSDFREKFIRAEVISWNKLMEAGSWTQARKLGLSKTEGKDYAIQDGDVVEFKL